MSNNSYSIGDNHIGWSEDFTKVRLASYLDGRFDSEEPCLTSFSSRG